jgi:hypothetical protein
LARSDRGPGRDDERAGTTPAGSSPRRTRKLHSPIRSRRAIGALVALLTLAAAAVAIAKPTGTFGLQTPNKFDGLAKVGPVDPQTGFPAWYKDHNGLELEPCIDPKDPNCLPPGNAVDPNKPLQITSTDPTQNNFPDEFFYQNADSKFKGLGDDATARVEIMDNLEGAFATGPVRAGDQMVFSRLRVRIDGGLRADTKYMVAHPYGTDEITTDATAGQGAATNTIFATQDVGITPLDFAGALNSRLSTFLKWDPNVAPAAPKGYIGDPNLEHVISGSPVDINYVAVVGPALVGTGTPAINICPKFDPNADGTDPTVTSDPNTPSHKFADQIAAVAAAAPSDDPASDPANDCVYNPLFTLAGKIETRSGVDVNSATYSRAKGGKPHVTVLAESNADQQIALQDSNPDTRVTGDRAFDATLFKGALGQYFARATITNLPAGTAAVPKVEVVNQSDAPATVKDVQPVDTIKGSATYDGSTLTVTAASSDEDADGAGNPAQLSVLSDVGQTIPVDDAKAQFSKPMALVGDGTVNQTASFANVVAPPSHVIVTSAQGGSERIAVDVTAPDTDPAPLKANAGPDQSITDGATEPASISLTGSGSTGNIDSYQWTGPYDVDATTGTVGALDQAAGPAPAAVSGRPSDATVAPPQVAPPTSPITYAYKVTVTGDTGSDSAFMKVNIGGGPVAIDEVITPGKQRYTQASDRFTVDGNDNIVPGNSITVHNGCSPTGPVIGTIPIAADTTWSVDVRGQGILPMGCTNEPTGTAWVTEVSKLGTVLTLQVDVRPTATNPVQIQPPANTAARAGTAAAAAVPLLAAAKALATPALGRARVAIATTAVTPLALTVTGVPLRVSVPARAKVLRVRVLTTRGKVLFTAFHKVKGATKTHKVKFLLRSRKLRSKVRSGQRLVLEITPGTSRTRLGKATRASFRVR